MPENSLRDEITTVAAQYEGLGEAERAEYQDMLAWLESLSDDEIEAMLADAEAGVLSNDEALFTALVSLSRVLPLLL